METTDWEYWKFNKYLQHREVKALIKEINSVMEAYIRVM